LHHAALDYGWSSTCVQQHSGADVSGEFGATQNIATPLITTD